MIDRQRVVMMHGTRADMPAHLAVTATASPERLKHDRLGLRPLLAHGERMA
jgi:hypothetical protein